MDTIEQPQNGKPPSPAGIGPILGIIIIIILLALGSLYYFTIGIEDIRDGALEEEAMMEPADEAALIESQSSSTDLADIEADINATDFSGLDDATQGVDASLESQ